MLIDSKEKIYVIKEKKIDKINVCITTTTTTLELGDEILGLYLSFKIKKLIICEDFLC